MPSSSGASRLEQFIASWWLPFGLLLLFTGMFVFPSRGGYKTVIYLSFIAPSFLLILVNLKSAIMNYFSGRSVLLAALAIIYLACSSLWSADPEFGNQLKYSLILITAGYGIYYLISYQYLLFSKICIFSVVIVGCLSLVWIFDFYYGNEYPLTHRFLIETRNHFGIYEFNAYANFRNPLLLSHPLVFFFTLGLYFVKSLEHLIFRSMLIISLFSILLLIVLAQTQMAWIVTSIILTFHITDGSAKPKRNMFWLILLVFALLSLGIWYLHYAGLKTGLSYRFDIWVQSLFLILDKPWLGHGLGGYPLIVIDSGHAWGDVHNIYLALLYYSGALGFALFCLAGLSMLLSARSCATTDQSWFFRWLIFLLFIQMTDGGGLISRPSENWFSLWIPAMFLLAETQIWRSKIRE